MNAALKLFPSLLVTYKLPVLRRVSPYDVLSILIILISTCLVKTALLL